MANIETPQPNGNENPANPNIGSQDSFNKFIDKHVEHLFDGDNSYNHRDVSVMAGEERAIRRAGHSMPSFQENQVVAGSGEARSEDPDDLVALNEQFNQPAIQALDRNVGRRKTDALEIGKLAITTEQE